MLLTIGSKGDVVVRLQELIGVTADGVFGSQTAQALMEFTRRQEGRAVAFADDAFQLRWGLIELDATPPFLRSPSYASPLFAALLGVFGLIAYVQWGRDK